MYLQERVRMIPLEIYCSSSRFWPERSLDDFVRNTKTCKPSPESTTMWVCVCVGHIEVITQFEKVDRKWTGGYVRKTVRKC